MGDCMARFSHGFGCFVHGLCSQLCESKVRPPFGRRVESLDLPSPGGRNLGRHCRQDWNKAHGGGANGRCYVCTHFLFILQDLARWLAPSGQYKVSDGFNTGFGETRELCSDGSVGVYSWLVRTIWVQGGSLIRERSDGGELQESQRGNGEPTGKTRSQKVEEGRRWRRKRSKGKIKREMMNVLRLQKAKINLRGGLSQQRRERFSENREAKQNSIMAYEVTGLLENLKFSEEELVDVSNMDDEILTEMDGSDKWVVEHTLESQEEEGRGGAQEGRWKMPSTSTVRPRAVKRTLKGKNEVCHPITSKKRKTVNTTLGEEDEFSKATSPIKLSAQMVEAGSQPRREP
ncbi:hypothetical protein V6N13_084732 [Hibiscus sabdariffa]